MGLFSSIFGGGNSSVPQLSTPNIDTVIPGVNVTGLLRQQRGVSQDLIAAGSSLTSGLVSSANDLSMFPTLGQAELTELANAQNTFNTQFNLAANNVNNATAGQISGLSRTLALQGVNTTQGGSNALFSGIAAKNQASLNDMQSNIVNQLLSLRQNLISGAYQRNVNRFNALSGLQSTFLSQGTQLSSNIFNAATNQQAAKLSVDQTNINNKLATEQANSSRMFGLGTSIIGGGLSLAGSLFGAK